MPQHLTRFVELLQKRQTEALGMLPTNIYERVRFRMAIALQQALSDLERELEGPE